MILHWRQLTLHYSGEIAKHQERFEEAGQTTYAVLCCRFAVGNDRLASSGGPHAEVKLLSSVLWKQEVPAALKSWSPLDHGRIVVTMAINRAPCPECTDKLVSTLRDLQWKHAMSFQRARFILACRGAYRGQTSGSESPTGQDRERQRAADHPRLRPADATSVDGLMRLDDAGWEVCVLQIGNALPPSGIKLLQMLECIAEKRAVVVRLDE